MAPELSLPCSQQPATCTWLEPDLSSPGPTILFKNHFNVILASAIRSSGLPTKNPSVCVCVYVWCVCVCDVWCVYVRACVVCVWCVWVCVCVCGECVGVCVCGCVWCGCGCVCVCDVWCVCVVCGGVCVCGCVCVCMCIYNWKSINEPIY